MAKEWRNEMRQGYEITEIGRQLGTDAVEHAIHCAEEYCFREKTRLGLTNEARINALHVEGASLSKVVRDLEERLKLAPRPGETRSRKRRILYYWTTGILLAIAGFGFAIVALAPFRLGAVGTLYCLGIALVTPFATEAFLELWSCEHVLKAAALVVFAVAIVGGMLLGSIRGQLVARQIEDSTPAVVIDGENSTLQTQQPSFYESTRHSLEWLLVLMALAIDLGAGVAVHRAIQLTRSGGEDHKGLSRELVRVQARLGEIVHEITALENDPAIFEAGFWRDYYRAMLTRAMRKAVSNVALFGLTALLACPHVRAQQRLDLVIALDLSRSEAVKDRDGTSEFSKNIKRVEQLLAQIPAGTTLTVLGITENSLSEPYILWSAQVSQDLGYFGERLETSRRELIRAWHTRVKRLEPITTDTDIFGALFVASECLRQARSNSSKIVVLLSDMRHTNPDLGLKTIHSHQLSPLMASAQKRNLIANLTGVLVYCAGVNASGESVQQWNSLKDFWTAYFKASGATLELYCDICSLTPRDSK